MTARNLYAIATKNGLVEHSNKEDPFHMIIYGVTGKTSVKDLTKREMKMKFSVVQITIFQAIKSKIRRLFQE